MSRSDIIVTACVLLSAVLAIVAPIMAVWSIGAACLVFMAACYLVLLAMFVVMYVGRNDG